MKSKLLSTILLVAVVLGVVYAYRDPLSRAKTYFQDKIFPCTQPVSYSIGVIDPKFGLSKDQVIQDLAVSAKLWNNAEHKSLLQYQASGGSVTVNFIYDSRQQSTQQLKSLGLTINDDENTYNTLKAKYNSLQATYEQKKSALDTLIANYKKEKASYDEQVAYWNARGGAPKDEYNKLEAEKESLTSQAELIQTTETDFNNLVSTINALANVLNQLISQLNLKVGNYNNIGTQEGGEFEEGVYKSSINSQEIDIYQFDNQTKLLRVLTHELGHALGLGHVSDAEAIMYRLNQGKEEKLTDADRSALNTLCSSKFNFSNFANFTP
jgi:hypothetical protein